MPTSKSKPVRSTEPQRKTVRLADLTPHPDQNTYFRKTGEYEYAELKRDIAANGIRNPIEVMPAQNRAGLPKFTIVSGHTRKAILEELEFEETEVLIRNDLREATRDEVNREFLIANVARRQQSRLAQARAAVALFLNEREAAGDGVFGDPFAVGELRERIGKIVGMSGRNLQRYLNVLSAPEAVQEAFDRGTVKLVDAARVASLHKKDQEKLAARLAAGDDAKAVFASVFGEKSNKHVKPADALAAFARSLAVSHADLGDRLDEVRENSIRRHEPALRDAKKMIRLLLARLDAANESEAGGAGRGRAGNRVG